MKMNLKLLAAAALAVFLGAGCATGTPVYAPPTSTPVPSSEPPAPPSAPTPTPEATKPVDLKFPGKLPDDQIVGKQIRMTTDAGDIVISLYPATAPLAVSNFVYLAKLGYYDGLLFHRVCPNPDDKSCGGITIAQGGDPFTRDLPLTDPKVGTGGPGYEFPDELKDNYQYVRGIVAMANHGANTNGSQFFIMKGDIPFPKSYTIFGKVTEGLDVVDKLVRGSKMLSVTVEDAKK